MFTDIYYFSLAINVYNYCFPGTHVCYTLQCVLCIHTFLYLCVFLYVLHNLFIEKLNLKMDIVMEIYAFTYISIVN